MGSLRSWIIDEVSANVCLLHHIRVILVGQHERRRRRGVLNRRKRKKEKKNPCKLAMATISCSLPEQSLAALRGVPSYLYQLIHEVLTTIGILTAKMQHINNLFTERRDQS